MKTQSRTLLAIAIALVIGGITEASAQNTQRTATPPSRNYSPTNVPVSVRPDKNYRNLTGGQSRQERNSMGQRPGRMSQGQYGRFANSQQTHQFPGKAPTRVHRLSDTTLPNLGITNSKNTQKNSQIRRTSFQTQDTEKSSNEAPEPTVPEILSQSPQQKKSATSQTPRLHSGRPQVGQFSPAQPETRFAPGQASSQELPSANESSLPGTQPQSLGMPKQDSMTPAKLSSLDDPRLDTSLLPGKHPGSAQTSNQIPVRVGQNTLPGMPEQREVGNALSKLPEMQNRLPQQKPKMQDEVSPGLRSSNEVNNLNLIPVQEVGNQSNPTAAAMPDSQTTVEQEFPKIPSDSASDVHTQSLVSKLQIPQIRIETQGPKSVSKGKEAEYRMVVENKSNFSAENLAIQIALPNHVRLNNVITNGGHREVLPGNNQQQIQWQIANLAAGQTLVMKMSMIASQARPVNLGVRWNIEPQKSQATISVTEPKLEMSISGPGDVMYQSKTVYTVTVLNSGNGTAEDVKVQLSKALGGARAPLGHIAPGTNKKFQVELSARNAGKLELLALAEGQAGLKTSATKMVTVRRAKLNLKVAAPKMKYAGGVSTYDIEIANVGDAAATQVVGSISLPLGVKYLSGIEGASVKNGQLHWRVGNIPAGDLRKFRIQCQMNASGQVKLDVGVRGASDLMAASTANTWVQTIADLVLTVEDPKGPLPTGEKVAYTIRVKNRGTRSANNVNLVMHFSKGIEPSSAKGLGFQIKPGEISFTPISSIPPGKQVEVQVFAQPSLAGNHTFRAQLKCDESDSLEVAQGTTKFYGDSLPQGQIPARPASNQNQTGNSNGQFGGGQTLPGQGFGSGEIEGGNRE